MTASTRMVQLATYQDHHGLKPIAATRRTNIIAVVCITAFVAWCVNRPLTMPSRSRWPIRTTYRPRKCATTRPVVATRDGS